uniref:Laminin subunit alpha-1 n=1 Tax=Mesocestoides corti TaxID=53468 RepID=A0A5K3FHX5_MESCO
MRCAVLLQLAATFFLFSSIYAQQNDFAEDIDYLDMDPDSLLAEHSVIVANATCGERRREYYCRLVEHAGYDFASFKRTKRQAYDYPQDGRTYKDIDGTVVECNYCDAQDPSLRHPIEYVVTGDSNLWWQSPSLAEGLQYHAVTIDIDLKQVYQIVFVLLRMGDSPRPANWILEKSIDGQVFHPWVFFAENAHQCRTQYQPMVNSTIRITSDSRPHKLGNTEVYCTTYFSQPQNLQAGEIIIPLTVDREGASTSHFESNKPIDPELIEFLSARFVRLRFQKLQTLSGDWMTLPDQLDPSVYNRYYYSIRNIKIGGKCVCNSHANTCGRQIIDGVPRAVCDCQHNTCGYTCEKCCPLFNQQPWRPGAVCEECNCHGKADSCVYNQTVANLQLSLNRYNIREGGGVCVDCREQTTGVNCEDCLPGYYRPLNVGPDAKDPCVPCNCNIHGSTGVCVSNDALMPEKQPGDCICKEGYAGRDCDRCAEGYYESPNNPRECIKCPCDIAGSHRGQGYRCQPPCNCKANVDPDSLCRACKPEHFNLAEDDPEGCQPCFCMGLSKECQSVSVATARRLEYEGKLGTVDTIEGWTLVVPSSTRILAVPPSTFASTNASSSAQKLRVTTDDVDFALGPPASVRGQSYYWSAPEKYLGKQLTAYRGQMEAITRFSSPSIRPGMTGGYYQPHSGPYYDNYTLGRVWINEPDIILEGHGIRLSYSAPLDNKQTHRVQRIRLHESMFRVLVESGSGDLDRIPIHQTQAASSEDSASRQPYSDPRYGLDSESRVDYTRAGRPATIVDIMTVLSNVSRLYVKARYTDDQAYTELRRVALERAERGKVTTGMPQGVRTVEECRCPPGHTGTSCEECEAGYWRDPSVASAGGQSAVDTFLGLVNPIYKRVCVPCDCNGRSDTCDPHTGHCFNCKYNTWGAKCEECSPGFHLDPKRYGSDICQPCECPSLNNQKTNSCVALSNSNLHGSTANSDKPYACLNCEDNTRGQFCEACVEMYYGNPLLGQPCRPCDCGSMAVGCDTVTGECHCGHHTAGPRCTECEPGSHGDPLRGEACTPCGCHPRGSRTLECDKRTGRCQCNLFYEGQRCDRCVVGRGNVDAGCPPCNCDPLGSIPQANASCDPVTGQCVCKPGVGGTLECDRCADGYYNMGINGCQSCECSNRALSTACHPTTGQCQCGEHVIGEKCDRCRTGYYWNGSEPHCLPCDCGPGAVSTDCDIYTGQCLCARYAIGRRCDQCEPGFWGPSRQGCQRCPECPNGRVCDQITGKCICPPNTEGDRCESCAHNSYDYNPVLGCKECNCSAIGSVNPQGGCDLVSGQCVCKSGFAGQACDECAPGYFGFPDCQPCMCSLEGSLRNSTNGDQISCDPITGACVCKPNVEGERCDRCIPGSFGLSADYPLGCYACFCFPTTKQPECEQLKGYRSVPETPHRLQLVGTDNVYMPGGPLVDLQVSAEATTGSSDLPDLTIGQSQFRWRFSQTLPTFLILPHLRGPHTRSYGSILVEVHSDCLPTGKCGFESWESSTDLVARGQPTTVERTVIQDPLKVYARMTALNGQLEFEYQPETLPPRTPVPGGDLGAEYNTIWMKESEWVLTRIHSQTLRVRPSRSELMLALTNITSFSVRLAMPGTPLKAISVNYRTRTARSEALTQMGTPITTIETCICPDSAKGDHCELADDLHYFPPVEVTPSPDGTYFDSLVDIYHPSNNGSIPAGGKTSFNFEGGVRTCECNGMSRECDHQTGYCLNCVGNTAGAHCEVCAQGYSGDPTKGVPCTVCRCPSESANYAKTCHPYGPLGSYVCECLQGYAGALCDRCDTGYYGDPLMMVPCRPCDCDLSGSQHQNCNMKTGQCVCLPGITGRRCDQCQEGHVVDAGRCIDCRGECTGELLERTAAVSSDIDSIDLTELAHRGLRGLQKQAEGLKDRYSLRGTIPPERDLIDRAAKLTADLSRISLSAITTLPQTVSAIDNASCANTNATIRLSREVVGLERRLSEWIGSMRSLHLGSVDEQLIQQWHQRARLIRQEISRLDLQPTSEWARELLDGSRNLEEQLEAIQRRASEADYDAQIRRLKHYQREQRALLDAQKEQLYKMANQTQRGLNSIKSIEDVMDTASGSAIDTLRLNQSLFEDSLQNLQQNTTDYQEPTMGELNRIANLLEQSQSFDQVPSVVPADVITVVHNLDRTKESIVAALDRPGVDRTLEGREAYKAIADTIWEARNFTDEAMQAVEDIGDGSTSASLEASLADVEKRHSELAARVAKLGERLEDEELISEANHDRLLDLKSAFRDINVVLERTLKSSALTKDHVSNLGPLVASTRPELEALAGEIAEARKRFDSVEKAVRGIEKQFNEIEGTANLAVDQANSTQRSLLDAIAAAERRSAEVDKKMASVSRLASLARSLLDLIYASLGKDPIPLRLTGDDCVYTLVPYHVTKSRVFDLEFWFTAALQRAQGGSSSQKIRTNSVLLVGRRAFPGRTMMFAVTVEPSGNLRFSWSQPDVVGGELGLEIGPLNGTFTNRIRVTSVPGRVDLYLQQVPEGAESLVGLPIQSVTFTDDQSDSSISSLLIDNQLEVRVGGPFHDPHSADSNAPLMESWGDGGAEEMWSRLQKMDHAKGCLYDLKLSGHRLGFPDFAKADRACTQQTEDFCKIHTNFRPLIRDGYIWEKSSALDAGLEPNPRPKTEDQREPFLEYMQLHDFAADDSYSRITNYESLSPCDKTIDIHLQKLAPYKANSMVLTFYNYREDYGITVESKGHDLVCSRWHGNLMSGRGGGAGSSRQRGLRQIRVSPISLNYWTLEERLAEDCAIAKDDDYVFFVGGIPPGHYELRRAMKEYGLSTNGFRGRIGLATSGIHVPGSLLIDSYTKAPIRNYGDTLFSDMRQTEEAYTIAQTAPDNQYCLTLIPLANSTSFELKPRQFAAPWVPEIGMTVRFRPVGNDEVNLLRMQVAENNLWFRVWLTSDLRVGIAIPSDPTKFITREIFGTHVIRDPTNNLAAIKAREAQIFDQPLFTESVLTIQFGDAKSKRLTVLFDQRPVQTWTLSQPIPKSAVLQVHVGPELNSPTYHEFSISNLVIGKHRVDFAADMVDTLRNKRFYRIGECGGQLRPRFVASPDEAHETPLGDFVYQGLDLPAPPTGRRLRSIFEDCGDVNPQVCDAISENVTKEWPSIIHSLLSPKPSKRVRVRSLHLAGNGKSTKNCLDGDKSSAWFNGEAYWEVSDIARVLNRNNDFRVTIGFRTRPQNDTSNSVGVLGAFNFGFKSGTLFVLLSERQVHLVHEAGANGNTDFVWSSPHLDLHGNAWHRLELLPVNMQSNEVGGEMKVSRMRFILDYHEVWIEEPMTWRVPVSVFIGGHPSTRSIKIGSKRMTLNKLFGCVDELTLGGHEFDLAKSRLPVCPTCFTLNSKAIHVLPKIQDLIQPKRGLVLPLKLNIATPRPQRMGTVEFSFEVLYDSQKIGVESLFVMVFESSDSEDLVHLWIYLDRYMLFVTHLTTEEKVSFSSSASEPSAWHYASVKVFLQDIASVIEISTQSESSQTVILKSLGRLRAIYYGSDEAISPEVQSEHHGGTVVPPFMGCLKNLQLSIDEGARLPVEFPESTQHLVHGVCPL